jgi:hypothetical protein
MSPRTRSLATLVAVALVAAQVAATLLWLPGLDEPAASAAARAPAPTGPTTPRCPPGE